VEAVLAPKVQGTWILERLTRGLKLDFMAFLSSVASTWGAQWLGPYAAANTFLDCMAHHLRALGRPAVSLNLGTWAGGGMGQVAEDERFRTYFVQMGYDFMSPEPTLEVLGRSFGTKVAQRILTNLDWGRFKPIFEAKRRRPLLELLAVDDGAQAPGGGEGSELLRRAASLEASERAALLQGHVRTRVAEVMGFADPSALQAEVGFFQLGMDSVMSVQLRKSLQADLGLALPPTVAFEHPTVKALAGFLCEAVALAAPVSPAVPAGPVEPVGRVGPGPGASPGAAPGPTVDAGAVDGESMAGLSEEELVRLLASELSSNGVE
jgi:myxalamid-type polyketide synthase MxaE and MxaD